MRHLCDSNVFLALAVGQHAHHSRAAKWFGDLSKGDSAEFCRSTEISFLRLLTQKIAPDFLPLTNRQAWETFDRLMGDDAMGFAKEPDGIHHVWRSLGETDLASPKNLMDAYLAAFAITAGLRMVSFDHDFKIHEKNGLDLLLLED